MNAISSIMLPGVPSVKAGVQGTVADGGLDSAGVVPEGMARDLSGPVVTAGRQTTVQEESVGLPGLPEDKLCDATESEAVFAQVLAALVGQDAGLQQFALHLPGETGCADTAAGRGSGSLVTAEVPVESMAARSDTLAGIAARSPAEPGVELEPQMRQSGGQESVTVEVPAVDAGDALITDQPVDPADGAAGVERGMPRRAASGMLSGDGFAPRLSLAEEFVRSQDALQGGLSRDAGWPAVTLEAVTAAVDASPQRAVSVPEPVQSKAEHGLSAQQPAEQQVAFPGIRTVEVQSGDVSSTGLSAGKRVDFQPQSEVVQIRQIAARIQDNLAQGVSEMKIQLKPEHLGEMTVKVTLDAQQVSLSMRTETVYAKQMLENNFLQLRDALAEHGINVGSFDVGLQDNGGSSWERDNGFSREQEHQRPSGVTSGAVMPAVRQVPRVMSSTRMDLFA